MIVPVLVFAFICYYKWLEKWQYRDNPYDLNLLKNKQSVVELNDLFGSPMPKEENVLRCATFEGKQKNLTNIVLNLVESDETGMLKNAVHESCRL